MARCVDGHETQAEDFCDKCGMPVVHDAPAPQASVPAAPPEPEICPNCGARRQNHSLFCESCGYDYTTGALPQQDLRTELGLPPKDSPVQTKEEVEARSAEHGSSVSPSQQENSSVSDNDRSDQKDTAGSTDEASHSASSAEPSPASEPNVGTASGPKSDLSSGSSTASAPGTASTPIGSPKQHIPFVAEVWVDPQWYAFQESTDPMPPQGPPRIILLKDSALIGRHSASRNINPDIDCESDTGCSRRQAYLTSADGYWYINDLESSNGTFVAPATASLPDNPITTRTQITPDTRIYVGAWTRIVVRPAIEQELQS